MTTWAFGTFAGPLCLLYSDDARSTKHRCWVVSQKGVNALKTLEQWNPTAPGPLAISNGKAGSQGTKDSALYFCIRNSLTYRQSRSIVPSPVALSSTLIRPQRSRIAS